MSSINKYTREIESSPVRLNKISQKLLQQLFHFKSRNTLNDWIKGGRTVITFIKQYFTNADIEEYLATKSISRFEKYKQYENLYNVIIAEVEKIYLEMLKENVASWKYWKDFLLSQNTDAFKIYTLNTYTDEVFEELLISYNKYLLENKIKNYREYMAHIESIYNAMSVSIYKYYFYNEIICKTNYGE